MYLDIIRPQEKLKTVMRIETYDLLDPRELADYNDLLATGVVVLKRIHKSVMGVPGNEFEESTPAKLIEIVTYMKEGL